jgi:hypothetical protein
LGIGSVLLFVVPTAGFLLYFFGAFSYTGVFRIHWAVSNLILWTSVLFLIAGIINVCWRIEGYAPIYKESDGFVTRVVRVRDNMQEYYVRGRPIESLKVALVRDWPFKKKNSNAEWHALDQLGNDVTDSSLESIDGQTLIVFSE